MLGGGCIAGGNIELYKKNPKRPSELHRRLQAPESPEVEVIDEAAPALLCSGQTLRLEPLQRPKAVSLKIPNPRLRPED